MWTYNTDYLCHHGIKGQKWGVRRYQNEDGSLTADGRKRYGTYDNFRYQQLKRKKNKYLTNEDLEFLSNRKKLEKDRKPDKKNTGISKMLTEAGTKTLANVATAAALYAGAKYLAKKYDLNAETITKGVLKVSGKVASTVVKETAKAGSSVAKSVVSGATEAAKESFRETRKAAASTPAARKYVQTVDNILKKTRR